ncbi:Uncharacterised protein g5268 [Pycnogonum litorale]
MNRAVTLIVLMIVTFAVISSVPVPEGTPEPTADDGSDNTTATAEPPQFVQSEIPSGDKNVEKRSAEGYEKFQFPGNSQSKMKPPK